MIFIKSLRWSNWFSYGEDNYIDFCTESLLQIMGVNGVGKTSIPLILEEVLFSKNSKGIKKQSLVNRYLDNPTLTAEVIMYKDKDVYKITLSRKTTAKLVLERNGIDISSHTTTNTYKTIQDIIGVDFKTFSQLIYQSSNSNLEFLTATDTNRKKFLISLFNLDMYLKLHAHFSSIYYTISGQADVIEGKVKTYAAWVSEHRSKNLTLQEILEIPKINTNQVNELSDLKANVLNISKTNADINKNNQLKSLLADLDISQMNVDIHIDLDMKVSLLNKGKALNDTKVSALANKKTISNKLTKLKSLSGTCHACLQPISEELRDSMVKDISKEIEELNVEVSDSELQIVNIKKSLSEIHVKEQNRLKQNSISEEFVRLTNQVDKDLPEQILDPKELSDKIFEIQHNIEKVHSKLKYVTNNNREAEAHNSMVEVVKKQLEQYTSQLSGLQKESKELTNTLTKIAIIKKAFSTSGLVNYKVEYLVKDLEDQINEYLSELSDGQFQLTFVLKGEKLNIDIIDNGITITIEELSAGELARINASTLLAIRKLMSAISSSKINILFLDEVMGVLDEVGKEKLIEVLHSEKELNTLLVSHEFSHPLIPKITIEKIDKVSKIHVT